jgi:2-dehydropantoate 2-reductase
LTYPHVVVVGPGGVGAYFGGMLARAGAGVTFLGRPGPASEHLKAIAANGLHMKTVTFDEYVSVETTTDPARVRDGELVLFCVKTTDTETATRSLSPHLSPDAIVLDLQNGFDNAERMRQLGVDPIPAAVYVAAAIEAPGEITHRGRGDLILGHPERLADIEKVVAWFEQADVGCAISDDIERDLWVKLTVNAMANAISALSDATYSQLAEFEPTWSVAMEVAREAVAVARADGYDLDHADVIERGFAVARSVGAATSSTQQDISRGRPTEIDALNGYIVRRGERAGIAVPVNRTLWSLVRLREA